MDAFFASVFSSATLLLAGSILVMGCKSERAVAGPTPPREQEIMRFRSGNPTKQPVVFGRIEVLDKSGAYALSSAILALDKKLSYADGAGNYRLVLEPGTHHFMTGQIGIHQSRLLLKVTQGDSVRIDFHLRPDLRLLD